MVIGYICRLGSLNHATFQDKRSERRVDIGWSRDLSSRPYAPDRLDRSGAQSVRVSAVQKASWKK